jgi:hypothetical protein
MRTTFAAIAVAFVALNVGAAQVQQVQNVRATGLLFTPDDQYRSIPLAATPLMGGGLPAATDLSKFFPSPGNQGQQASCVGWAVAALKSYQEVRERSWTPDSTDRQFSPAFIYNQIARQGCGGGSYILDALNLIRRDGVATLSVFPYSQVECSRIPTNNERQLAREFAIADWRRVNVQDELEVKSHVAAGFPVLFGMLVDSTFMQLSAGQVYRAPAGSPKGGHAVLVVGYDDARQAFKILNSWGTTWGDSGFGWIGYPAFRQVVREGFVAQDIVIPSPITNLTRGDFDFVYAVTKLVLHWRKVAADTWIEDAVPGSGFGPITFKATGKTTVQGTSGTIVRAQDRPLDIFVPDVGARGEFANATLQRHGGTNWQWSIHGGILK